MVRGAISVWTGLDGLRVGLGVEHQYGANNGDELKICMSQPLMLRKAPC